jgi:hypothetical protein
VVTSTGDHVSPHGPGAESTGMGGSRLTGSRTSMTCPCRSIARYRYVQRPNTFTYVASTNHLSPRAWRQGLAASMNSGVKRCTHQ